MTALPSSPAAIGSMRTANLPASDLLGTTPVNARCSKNESSSGENSTPATHRTANLLQSDAVEFLTATAGFDAAATAVVLASTSVYAALALAKFLEGDPLILVGMDLAFTKGRTHSEAAFHFESERTSTYDVLVPAIGGGRRSQAVRTMWLRSPVETRVW